MRHESTEGTLWLTRPRGTHDMRTVFTKSTLCIPVFLCLLILSAGVARAEIDKPEAVRIATAKVEKEKYRLADLALSRVTYETKSGNWLYPESRKGDSANSFRKAVQGKHYWILYWAPANRMTAGGDIAIILDAADGTLLHIYRGK